MLAFFAFKAPGTRETGQEMVQVYSTNDTELGALQEALEEQGIPGVVKQETIGRLISLQHSPLAEKRVFVPTKDLDRARTLIEQKIKEVHKEEGK